MGVSGSGKTTIGLLLASQLGWQFADADDYHSVANVEKMRLGIPLTDADRAPWLEALSILITGWITAGKNAVLACSALKQSYRDELHVGPEVKIVYLRGTPDLLDERLRSRTGHYMSESMLASQLATLEEPTMHEEAIVVNIAQSSDASVAEICARLGLPDSISP